MDEGFPDDSSGRYDTNIVLEDTSSPLQYEGASFDWLVVETVIVMEAVSE